MNDSELRKQLQGTIWRDFEGHKFGAEFSPIQIEIIVDLFTQALTARLDAVAGALPEKKQHQDWCDLLSIAAYANPEDVACSCDTPAFNEALAACHAAIDTVREGL